MLSDKSADLLVVDEDELTRNAAESWMHSEGYDGHCLPDGISALRFLEAYRPKFAVLDLTKLGDESIDVFESIRRAPRVQNLSLVVHVAVPDSTDSTDGFSAITFLTRGINWPEMRAEIERFAQ